MMLFVVIGVQLIKAQVYVAIVEIKMKKSERKQAKQDMRDATQVLLGEILTELRDKRDLAQEDLAYESGIDRSFMSKIETGKTTLSLLTLMRLTKALEVDTSDVIKELEKRIKASKSKSDKKN